MTIRRPAIRFLEGAAFRQRHAEHGEQIRA
jgi:hypothetical protein